MAPPSLWSALSLFLLVIPTLAADVIQNDYSLYPEGAQDCLYQAADTAGCTNGTLVELNSCQCKNENDFVIISAKCIGKNDYADVDETYSVMSEACDNSDTSLSITEAEFKKAAEEGKSGSSSTTDAASATQSSATSTASESAYVTTTSGGKTITVAPTQTNDNDGDEGSGLSTGTTIGIGVGAAAAGAAVVGALVFFCLRRRPKKEEDEHPMLPQPYQGANPSPYPPPYYDPKSGWTASPSSSPHPGGKDWNNPAAAQGPFLAPVAELPPQTAVRPPSIYEMDGGISQFDHQVGPVEMPGSDFQRRSGSHQDAWQKR